MSENIILDYLKHIVHGLVTKPDECLIEEKQDRMGVLFTITPAPEDSGKLLGRKAETIGAIRRLIRQKGFLHNARVSIKINIKK
jgi:predicted RNA-binding protein YlqC (UPF0109 family)